MPLPCIAVLAEIPRDLCVTRSSLPRYLSVALMYPKHHVYDILYQSALCYPMGQASRSLKSNVQDQHVSRKLISNTRPTLSRDRTHSEHLRRLGFFATVRVRYSRCVGENGVINRNQKKAMHDSVCSVFACRSSVVRRVFCDLASRACCVACAPPRLVSASGPAGGPTPDPDARGRPPGGMVDARCCCCCCCFRLHIESLSVNGQDSTPSCSY